jgi:hypothetical protein
VTFKIEKLVKDGSTVFQYTVDGNLIERETYLGGSLFLSALNKYLPTDPSNLDSESKWIIDLGPVGGSGSGTTTQTGLDGQEYIMPYPTTFYERQMVDGTDPMMGTPIQVPTFVDVTDLYIENWESVPILDTEIYVNSSMSGKITLAQWKLNNKDNSASGVDVRRLREMKTEFKIDLLQFGFNLNLNGEPKTTETPESILPLVHVLQILFNARTSRTRTINKSGEIQ